MAQADIDGFRISIDDTLAANIRAVDRALEGIEAHGRGAGEALGAFGTALQKFDKSVVDKADSAATAFEKIKKAIEGLKLDNLAAMNSALEKTVQSVNNLDSAKLSALFLNAKTPAENVLSTINTLIDKLAKLSDNSVKHVVETAKPKAEIKNEDSRSTTTIGTPSSNIDSNKVYKEMKELSDKIKALFKDIPVSLKHDLDITYFINKAEEIKKAFANIQIKTSATSSSTTESNTHSTSAKNTEEEINALMRLAKLEQDNKKANEQTATQELSYREKNIAYLKEQIRLATIVLEGKLNRGQGVSMSDGAQQALVSYREKLKLLLKDQEAGAVKQQAIDEQLYQSKVKRLNELYQEQLKLQGKIGALNNQRTIKQESLQQPNALLSPKQETLANEYAAQLAKINGEIKQMASNVGYVDAQNTKESTRIALLEQEIKLQKELDSALEKIYKKQMGTSTGLSSSQIKSMENEYARLLTQIEKIEQVRDKLFSLYTSPKVDSSEKSKIGDLYTSTNKEFQNLWDRKKQLEQETQLDLDKIRASHDRKRAERMIKDYESAEKTQTKIAEQEAKRRADIQSRWDSRRLKNYYNSSNFALNTGQKALSSGTLNDLLAAQKRLQNAMANTKPNTSEWEQLNKLYRQVKEKIDGIKTSMEGIKETSNNLMPSLKNLAMQMGLVFSVQQVYQWLKHMADVRAQFELQQIALRSIIQDKQKADEVFAQVQQLALKSPYSIMQLNTYTKQIAAYGVEADKLVGTTKQLADVSSGLGVEIGRIILAYGQVKTANYLRATEVRQFTEAGLNITQELANYFSELNGKMITAGDVTEMITKRMVKFEDVAEVFKRVTSAGGMFYNMQEKQAEGLAGMQQRLGDAYSIMLNQIGQQTQGLLVAFLQALRELIQNWRIVSAVMAPAIIGLSTYFAIAKGAVFVKALTTALVAGWVKVASALGIATKAQLANNAAAAAHPYAAIIAVVALLATTILEVCYATDQLTEDLQRMEREAAQDAADAVGRFRELADTVKDTSKSYDERKQAMDELQRSYRDILPSELLEIENIRAITDNYKQASEAIREYYRIKLEEEKRAQIDTTYNAEFTEDTKGIVNSFYSALSDYGASKATLRAMMDEIIEDVKNGAIKTAEEASREFANRAIKYYNIQNKLYQENLRGIADNAIRHSNEFDELMDDIAEYKEKLEDVSTTTLVFGSYQEEVAHRNMLALNNAFDEQKKKVEALSIALGNLQQIRIQQERKGNDSSDFGNWLSVMSPTEKESVVAAIEQINKAYKDLGINAKRSNQDIFNSVSDNIKLHDTWATAAKRFYNNYINQVKKTKVAVNDLNKAKFVQNIQAELDRVDGSKAVQEIRNLLKEVAKAKHIDLHLFDFLTLDVKTNFSSARKEMETQMKAFDENVARWYAAYKTAQILFINPKKQEEYASDVAGITKEMVDNYNTIKQAMSLAWKGLGGYDNKKNKERKQDKTEEILRERISLLKEANETFEKLSKEYDVQIARQMTLNNLMQRAKNLKIDKILSNDDLTNQGTYDALKKLSQSFGYNTANFKKKYQKGIDDLMKEISNQQFEIAVDINQSSRKGISQMMEGLLGGYDLYIELEDSGVNADIAKALFDVDETSLKGVYDRLTKAALDNATKIRQQTEKDFKGYKSIEEAKAHAGSDWLTWYVAEEKKVTDRLEKEYQTRMKNFSKYLKQSYLEAAQAKIEENSKLQDLTQSVTYQKIAVSERTDIDDKTKKELLNNINKQFNIIADSIKKEGSQKVNKALVDSFKESPIYEELLGDLSFVNDKVLDALLQKIKDLRQELDGSDPKLLKELTKYQTQLENAKISRSPISSFLTSIKELKKAKKELQPLLDENNASSAQELLVIKQKEYDNLKQEKAIYESLLPLVTKKEELEKKAKSIGLGDSFNVDETLAKIGTLSKEIEEIESSTQSLNSAQIQTIANNKALITSLEEKVKTYNELYIILQQIKSLAKQTNDSDQTEKMSSEEITDKIVELDDLLMKILGNKEKVKKVIDYIKQLMSAGEDVGELIKKIGQLGSQSIDVLVAGIKLFGGSISDADEAWYSFAQQAITSTAELIAEMIALETAVNSAAGIIGIIATALTLVASLMSTIFSAHEAELEDQIKSVNRQVNALERSFDNLSDAIDNAFSSVQLGANTEAAIDNLSEQNKKYQEMISLESKKKDADEDKIIEYNNKIEDNLKKMKELKAEYYNELGGLGAGSDILDAAKDFADAWADSFDSTGNGLKGLQTKFKDFFSNVLKQQAYRRIAERFIQPFADQINSTFDDYGQVNMSALADLINQAQSIQGNINSIMEDWQIVFERMGLEWNSSSSSSLSGLAAGIQGVTEETAQVVEAYLNSMRYYVADTNKELRNMVLQLLNPASDNAFLSELKAQTAQLNMLNKTLNSLVRAGHSKGGSGLKVFTN